MPTGDTGVPIDPVIDSTAEEIVEEPADPATDLMLDDLASTEAELDAVLGGG